MNIRIESKFLSHFIIVLMIIAVVIGILYCEHRKEEIINKAIEIEEENKRTIEIEINEGVDTNQAVQPISLGNFRLTAYCSCSLCCGKWANNRPNGVVYGAIGEELKEGYSIAVDPEVIPYKTEVIINGHTYKAQDCGAAITGNEIDVYFENHNEALNFGVQYAEVFVNK